MDDLKIVEADEGFCAILKKSEMHDLKRKVCRAIERRWRKEKKRSVPSPSAVFRYLSEFHDAEQEKIRLRTDVKAFILKHSVSYINYKQGPVRRVEESEGPQKTAILDMDATLAETTKKQALYCCKGFKSYQTRPDIRMIFCNTVNEGRMNVSAR